ncbi:PH domain-containing protein [Minisyncoccus archaeiphilus]|uniref:PH domain-containing protein n=1 Tax=Minisyncoccus archaeiphilus TaxID=3238481 RepID=UPI00399CA6A5
MPSMKIFIYLLVKNLVIFFIPYLILATVKWEGVITFILIFFVLPIIIYEYFYAKGVRFLVSDDKISIKSGVINKKAKIIPYINIQSVEVKYGLIRSWMGLATVNIWTSSQDQINAKGIMPDGRLVLLKEDAEWLANFLTSKKALAS